MRRALSWWRSVLGVGREGGVSLCLFLHVSLHAVLSIDPPPLSHVVPTTAAGSCADSTADYDVEPFQDSSSSSKVVESASTFRHFSTSTPQ